MRAGGERREREWRLCYGAARRGRREENACIHLPRNTQACTQHRRILCRLPWTERGNVGEGGWRARREERMAERGSTGTHKNVLSTPAPPVIGSNHRGSHASSFLTSRKSRNGRANRRGRRSQRSYDRRHVSDRIEIFGNLMYNKVTKR